MLGDVLRLSWSISLGSLLPSSLRLRPSKLSRSEGDCGRGSSCCVENGGPFFPFLASPRFGASLAQNHFPLTAHALYHHVRNTPAEAHPPAIWGFPYSPPTLSCSVAASLVSLLVKPYSFLKCPSQAPSPHLQLNQIPVFH